MLDNIRGNWVVSYADLPDTDSIRWSDYYTITENSHYDIGNANGKSSITERVVCSFNMSEAGGFKNKQSGIGDF